MPSPQELKHALHLEHGKELSGGYKIEDAKVTMQEKTAHEVYKFPLHITMQPPGRPVTHMSRKIVHGAQEALEEAVQSNKILYSSYGSPYEVHLEHVEALEVSGGLVEVRDLSVAKRRRDIPTLAQQQQKHEDRTSEGEMSEEDEEEALKVGYRVVKAHFKSSHCPVCGEEFVPGQRIAKPEGEKKRGGWTHVGCLTHQHEQQQQHHE